MATSTKEQTAMDFLFQDDDDDRSDKKNSNDSNEHDFSCLVCGGRDAYADASGLLVCSNCNTQSQMMSQTQEDTTMDVLDIVKVAAKTRGGIKMRAAGGPRRKRGRQPLEELDRSKPLPDLSICIIGFQSVLREGTNRLGKILRFKKDELKELWESVRTIWAGYVLAWRDGAEKYGAIYPDLRFSMRDLFLNSSYLIKLSRVLSYRAAETLRKELEDPNKKRAGQPKRDEMASDSESESDSDDSSFDGETMEPLMLQSSQIPVPGGRICNRKRPRSVLQLTLQLQVNNQSKEEAALTMRPSMNLAAAIIWLAISRIGVTSAQMVEWISNGSMPLLNAYDHLLTSEDKEKLQSLRSSFGMTSPPTAETIEKLAAKLAIVCGIKSTPQLPQYSDSEGDDDDDIPHEVKVVEKLRFVPLECVPMMIAQLVTNLGFNQRVLDIAMSLIGQPSGTESDSTLPLQLETADKWLPGSLQRAHPRRIKSTEYALAVIVVACKMCPGWETWSYGPPAAEAKEIRNNQKDGKGLSANASSRRFVPWNEEQFKLMRDEDISGYLDFYEETMLDRVDRVGSVRPFPAFSALLDKACEVNKTRSGKAASRGISSKDDDSSEPETEDTSTQHPTKPDFSTYISYPDKLSHTRYTPNQEKITLTAEPFHRCYARLVEYVAYKSHMAPDKIHTIVADLDEEVVALCAKSIPFRDKDQERKRRNKRRARKARKKRRLEVEPEMPMSFAPLILESTGTSREQMESVGGGFAAL